MNEEVSSFDEFGEQELSDEDMAILRAFEAMDNWPPETLTASTVPLSSHVTSPLDGPGNDDDMFTLFISEAEEDIHKMQRALDQLEPDGQVNRGRFLALQRAGHKLRGTAGAVGFPIMATIAHHVEAIAEEVMHGTLFPVLGANALLQAVSALALCLQDLKIQGKEQQAASLITELEAFYMSLQISPQVFAEQPPEAALAQSAPYSAVQDIGVLPSFQEHTIDSASPVLPPAGERTVTLPGPIISTRESSAVTAFLRVDVRRFETLTRHTEQLLEQHTMLENAQAQVEMALQELQASQARLQQLEPTLSNFLISPPPPPTFVGYSLIARILNESGQHGNTSPHLNSQHRRVTKFARPAKWDELDLERYTEKDLHVRSLKEAIADVAISTTRVQVAYAHFNTLQQEYMARVFQVRSAALLMRQAAFGTLVPRLQDVIAASAFAREQQVQFEIIGEATEIDQDILESLATPLVQLLQTCIAGASLSHHTEQQEPARIWLHAQEIGNDLMIEVGFSMPVQGGAVEAIREAVTGIRGTISLQRNASGGMSFVLHFPHAHGSMQCLLVRADTQRFIVPLWQVERIGDLLRETLDQAYPLHELLRFPILSTATDGHMQPVLLVSDGTARRVGIIVDEVIGEINLVVKPLTAHLQRPGISGAAIDGQGSVLLLLDLPVLVTHAARSTADTMEDDTVTRAVRGQVPVRKHDRPCILIADDSVYLRQALRQILRHANYEVIEARDGLEAMEKLRADAPDIFLLDIEMPNLNGYDVLNMMRLSPEFASVKVIMLTSRHSNKHMQHALELGAHDYLTKPCSQETLLEIIRKLLQT